MDCEKRTHAMTLVDPYVVREKNTHAMTLVVLSKKAHMQLHWWIHMWFVKRTHILMSLVVC